MQVTIEQYSDFLEFDAHFENGGLVVNKCEGIDLETALSIFPHWALEEMSEESKKQNG